MSIAGLHTIDSGSITVGGVLYTDPGKGISMQLLEEKDPVFASFVSSGIRWTILSQLVLRRCLIVRLCMLSILQQHQRYIAKL